MNAGLNQKRRQILALDSQIFGFCFDFRDATLWCEPWIRAYRPSLTLRGKVNKATAQAIQ